MGGRQPTAVSALSNVSVVPYLCKRSSQVPSIGPLHQPACVPNSCSFPNVPCTAPRSGVAFGLLGNNYHNCSINCHCRAGHWHKKSLGREPAGLAMRVQIFSMLSRTTLLIATIKMPCGLSAFPGSPCFLTRALHSVCIK